MVAQDPAPETATLTTSYASPAGSGQGTSGVTCTAIARDPTRNRYILGNHGQPIEGSASPALSSLITLDGSVSKVSEVALNYGSPYAAIAGVQGIAVDPAADVVGVCVPPIAAVSLFDPDTLLFTGQRLSLSGIVAQPNGLARDTLRMGWWVTDNADGKIRLISDAGVLLKTYTPSPLQLVGLDHLDYDEDNDWLIFSSGGSSTTSRGRMWAIDIETMRVVRAAYAAEAPAPEGVCRTLDTTGVLFASDGEYHSLTPWAIPSPDNVNRVAQYPAAALAAYHFARIEAVGQNYRIIADILAGTAATDFSIYTNTITATVTAKTFRFKARSNDGQTYPIFWRLGSTIFQGSVGPSPSYCELPNMTVAGSAAFQIGLRKGGAPYNTGSFCDITIEPLRLLP